MVERLSNSTSRSMGVSSRGRRVVKDVHDLFATLMVSLDLRDHRQFFKLYSYSFTTDEACFNLSSLKFAQSNRSPDPKNHRRIITTTTTTTFLMNRDVARLTCRDFLEARLVEHAAEGGAMREFKERGVWKVTPKGFAVLDRFISINGISSPELLKLFSQPENQPLPGGLIYLDRSPDTDEVKLDRSTVEGLWRRLVGRTPNEVSFSVTSSGGGSGGSPNLSSSGGGGGGGGGGGRETPGGGGGQRASSRSISRSSLTLPDANSPTAAQPGIPLRRFLVRSKGSEISFNHCTPALSIVDWFVERTSVAYRQEAAEVAVEFVKLGWLFLAQEKGKGRGEALVGVGFKKNENGDEIKVEFRGTEKAVYRVTEAGGRAAGWFGSSIDEEDDEDEDDAYDDSVDLKTPTLLTDRGGRKLSARQSNSHAFNKPTLKLFDPPRPPPVFLPQGAVPFDISSSTNSSFDNVQALVKEKESNTLKLSHILSDPALRTLFRAFLKSCYCEENLMFVLEVQEFRKRFSTSSSAAAGPATRFIKEKGGEMSYHLQELIERAFWIYNKYLAPLAPSEVNVEHAVRSDVTTYVQTNLAEAAQLAKKRHEAREIYAGGPTMTASQLQTMLVLFERVQGQTFRLMASDSIPKFIKTEAFLSHLNRSTPSLAGSQD